MKNRELMVKALHKAVDHSDANKATHSKGSLGISKPSKAYEEYELRKFGTKLRMMCVNDTIEGVALYVGLKSEEVAMIMELPPLRISDVKK